MRPHCRTPDDSTRGDDALPDVLVSEKTNAFMVTARSCSRDCAGIPDPQRRHLCGFEAPCTDSISYGLALEEGAQELQRGDANLEADWGQLWSSMHVLCME